MSDESLLPFLTEFDPPLRAEGSIDPLGLYPIADALGVRLASGVRERQSKPRYLTLALAGMAACDDEIVAAGEKKGIPAWLVYEWLVVAALVREWQGKPNMTGIPGQDKVRNTLAAPDVVCERTYLKTPTVFGFHGIYRVLGVKAGLFDADNRPLAPGFRILQAWEKDQGLAGFVSGHGPGNEFRQALASSIRKGIEAGHVGEQGPKMRDLIASHLSPHAAGDSEAGLLWQSLLQNDPMRAEYGTLLVSKEGQIAWTAAEDSEREFHDWIKGVATLPMQQLVVTIQAFERLARSLTDAWQESLWQMTQSTRALSPKELGAGKAVQACAHGGKDLFADAVRELGVVDPAQRVRAERALTWVGESSDPALFAANLLQHHIRIQKAKPPAGKRSWFDLMNDGLASIRPAYQIEEFQQQPDRYVHQYRTTPLWSFAKELERVRIRDEQD
jgi:hypothetical protein